LFENYREKGEERWEIYAWAVRQIIINNGKFNPCEIPLREKMVYEAYMQQKPGAPEPTLKSESPTLLNL
jgi:hypothetical protein